MRRGVSFGTRVLIWLWLFAAVAVVLPSVAYRHILGRELEQEARRDAAVQVNIIHWMLQRQPETQTVSDLGRFLSDLGARAKLSLSYIADGGKVIAHTDLPTENIAALDNHASRPEIVEARSREIGIAVRFSATLKQEAIFAARAIQGRGAIPSGLIRVAVPYADVRKRLAHLDESLLLVVLLTFAGAVPVSWLIARRIRRPVQAVMEAADAVGKGDYARRVDLGPSHELAPLADAINDMAENIGEHIRTVTDQKRRVEAILNGMREGVMLLDARGRLQAVNRSLGSLIADPERYLGKRPMEVLLSPELQAACDLVLKGEAHAAIEIPIERDRVYEINIVRLEDEAGPSGAVVVFHDISELKRLEQIRRDFVANVSHELRTPLTSIKGYTETLLADGDIDTENSRSFLQTILKNADHMSRMVNDLLQLARLEAQPSHGDPAPVDAALALALAMDTVAPIAREKDVRIENALPLSSLVVFADTKQLVQVFQNLFENAVRYSPPGAAVTVSAREEGNFALFSVKDAGPGIPRQHRQRIFERFYRVEKHRGSDSGGTGLGLAICRHIVRNHGGNIWVESRAGEGATFHFTLRRAGA